MNTIADNLCRVRATIKTACEHAGRNPDEVRLIAVSKTMDVETVRQAFDAGQCLFGENREQELTAKAEALPAEARWHFIGHLQRNKVRPVLARAHCIHSVDRAALLQRIDRVAGEMELRVPILVQVNVSGENSKFGIPPEQAEALVEKAVALSNVRCDGLMTLAPFGSASAELHRVFAALRELRDRLETGLGTSLPELSMGMSADYTEAIAEGATLVRIGSAVFGRREP
ncbi:MAG: YggS family pyridoxal phosphate-dependent enzyme [Verrucomicrobiota bacterium]